MGMGAIKVGQRLIYGGSAFRIYRAIEGGFWILEDLANGRFTEHATLDLLRAWSSGDLTFPGADCRHNYELPVNDLLDTYTDTFLLTYPEEAWVKAKMKLQFVLRLRSAPITQRTLLPLIKKIWDNTTIWTKDARPTKAPSCSSVANWIRAYRRAGHDARVLIDRTQDRGNRNNRFDQETTAIVDDFIQTRYLTLERQSLKDALRDIRGYIEHINQSRPASLQLLKPGMSFLVGRVAKIPDYDVHAARYGPESARIRFRSVGSGAPATRPLQRVAMDHCRLNLFVVDEKTSLPLGRPWLTLLLDECTRVVVGYYIGFDEPSNVSVARAIRHAIGHKELDPSLGIKNQWDAWGVMEEIVVDNGLELHGETMESGCAIHGIKIQYCPRKKPWFKGKIERFFRSFDQLLVSAFPGKTFEDIFKRADYEPDKHAVLTLGTLRKIVQIWIVDHYHQREHRALHKSPSQAWEEGIGGVDRYLPSSSVFLDAAFSRLEHRRLDKDGIECDSIAYQSADLGRIRQEFGSEMKVEVRVMDDDLSWITVAIPGRSTLIKVPALDQAYTKGLTRWQHTICKRYVRLKYKRDGIDLELFQAKERIRELIALDASMIKRRSRTSQKRFMGEESLAAGRDVVTKPPKVASGTSSPALARSDASVPAHTEVGDVPCYDPVIRSDSNSH